jgi:hypothetical protein
VNVDAGMHSQDLPISQCAAVRFALVRQTVGPIVAAKRRALLVM